MKSRRIAGIGPAMIACLLAGMSMSQAQVKYLAVEYKGGFRYVKADFEDSVTFATNASPQLMTFHGESARTFDLSGAKSFGWVILETPTKPVADITLGAGSAERALAPFSFQLPEPSARHIPFLLVSAGDSIPLQRDGEDSTRVHGVLKGPLAAGSSRKYQLIKAVGNLPGPIEVNIKPDSIEVVKGVHRYFGYRTAKASPPEGVDAKFGRSGYLHPLYSPTGKVITENFPPDHRSHRGVFFAWPNGSILGVSGESDFWGLEESSGTRRFSRINRLVEGPVFSELDLQLESVSLGSGKVWIDEALRIRIYNLPGEEGKARIMDFRSIQKNVIGQDINFRKEQHGGVAYRASGDWRHDKGNLELLTSDGKTLNNSMSTPARWLLLRGANQGEWTSVGLLSHPGNLRHPELLTVHPQYRIFCFTASRLEDFTFASGETKDFRFRMIIKTGKAGGDGMEAGWKDFTQPMNISVQPL